MQYSGGYAGKILFVNLSDQTIYDRPLDAEMARLYVGGRGLGLKLLFELLPPQVDPLAPENVLIFTTGPITGLPCTGSRYVVTTKSPLTGMYMDSYCGGDFGAEMKFCGYDALVITGKASRPVYLYIGVNGAEIRDASHLWGLGCFDVEDELKKEVGCESASVAVVGPAGEKLVKFAHIATDYYHSAGRGGGGAVMGSKNLKGIVTKGNGGIKLARPREVLQYFKDLEQRIAADPYVHMRVKHGSPATANYTFQRGMLPCRNYSGGLFEGFEQISAATLVADYVVKDDACYGCNLPCGKFSVVRSGPLQGSKVVGPEYETLALFGADCGVDDLAAVIQANALSDDLGVDVISCANAIAFAMECFERGLITGADTGGLELRFGNREAVLEMVRKISLREGIGDLLAEGVRKAAQEIGQGAEDFAIQGKGMEWAAYDPRPSTAYALMFSITDRGTGCHRRGWPVIVEQELKPFSTEGRPELVKKLYDERTLLHCAVICDRSAGYYKLKPADFAELMSLTTGWDYTLEEAKALQERVATLNLLLNIRLGAPFTRLDNIKAWPKRFLEEPIPEGPAKGRRVSFEELDAMLKAYYALRGWDTDSGYPLRETAIKLNLGDEYDKVLG